MKTPEEIKQLAIECGIESIVGELLIEVLRDKLQAFYQRAYEEGMNKSRKWKDIAILNSIRTTQGNN